MGAVVHFCIVFCVLCLIDFSVFPLGEPAAAFPKDVSLDIN